MIIKKLKILAAAMLVTGATVADTRAVTDVATNVLQPVTVTLTVYAEKTGSQSSIGTGAAASFKTANVIAAVENALGGKNVLTNAFSPKATLDLLTYETITIPGSTNTVTNTSILITNETVLTNSGGLVTLALSTNIEPLSSVTTNIGTYTNSTGATGTTNFEGGATNGVSSTNDNTVTIGILGGNQVTISATNGVTNVIILTQGPDGATSVTNTNSPTIVLDANAVAIEGTNVPVTTNLEYDLTPAAIYTNDVTLTTNGGGSVVITVGTNTVAITTNTVTIPGVSTNSFGTNVVVTIGSDVVVSNGVGAGFGTNSTLDSTLAAAFTVSTNISFTTNTVLSSNVVSGVTNVVFATNETIATNLAIVTSTSVYTTNEVVTTNFTTNFGSTLVTNAATNIVGGPATLVIAEVSGTGAAATPVYTPIPTNILTITNEVTTNDIIADTATVTSGWTVQKLILNTTTNSVGTNVVGLVPVSLQVQGLVHSTKVNFAVASALTAAERGKIAVTNEAWTDVSGYGTNAGVPFIVGGTIAVGSPTASKVP
jgi:hypothetical protein